MARVLLAEDDTSIRGLIATTLGIGRHEVVTARDGSEAMAILAREEDAQALDVVLTDYAMPGADGIEVIRFAQKTDPTLACIIVTAFHDLDLATRGMQAGAVGFVAKPFKPDHLLAVVDRAVERRQIAAEVARNRAIMPMLERFTMVLANTLESKDLSTGRHSERLARMADLVGMRLDLTSDERMRLRLGAGLHDVGKVAVPEALLNKTDPLDDEEVAILRSHPDVGAAILEGTGMPEDVQLIIRHHHERFDGEGYPAGLRGAEIPLGARIVGAVDAVDVMLHGRVYCARKGLDEVIGELVAQRARHFDPEVVDALVEVLDGGNARITGRAMRPDRETSPNPAA